MSFSVVRVRLALSALYIEQECGMLSAHALRDVIIPCRSFQRGLQRSPHPGEREISQRPAIARCGFASGLLGGVKLRVGGRSLRLRPTFPVLAWCCSRCDLGGFGACDLCKSVELDFKGARDR